MLGRWAKILVLLLYGGVSLPGSGLHALCGCAHFHTAGDSQAKCRHAHHQQRTTSESTPKIVRAGIEHQHGSTCPVCQFQAQGQMAAVAGPTIVLDACLLTAAPRPQRVAASVNTPFDARGPPPAAAIS